MLSLNEAYKLITNAERERSLLITNPREHDNPIVFANDAFVRLTGYTRPEVLGRNCRFLQGEDTDPAAVAALHDAIARCHAITVDILNYTKGGTPFWNRLRVRPYVSDTGEVEAFIGLQNRIDATEVGRADASPGGRTGRGPLDDAG